MKAKVSTSTHRLNGLTVTVKSPPDPYRALLETATRDEETALAELAKIEPRCTDLRNEIERIRKVKASILAMLGEEPEEESRQHPFVGRPNASRRVPAVAEILRETGRPMYAKEIMEGLRSRGHLLPMSAYNSVYACLKANQRKFRHEPGGLWSLIPEAK